MLLGRSSSPNYQFQGAWNTAIYSGLAGWAELPGDTVFGGLHPRHTALQSQVGQVQQPNLPGGKASQETVYHGLFGSQPGGCSYV